MGGREDGEVRGEAVELQSSSLSPLLESMVSGGGRSVVIVNPEGSR